MKLLCKDSFFLMCLINVLIIVIGQTSRNDKKHLPIEVIVNPSKASINPDEKLIESESKAIELKIQSDANNSGKIDLTIAAAKEVKEIKQESETLNRYSPQYNAASDRVDKDETKNSKDDISPTISHTARQDPNTLYQSSEFADVVPYDVMRQIYGQPQAFLFSRDNFSPLQNLRHLEENLAREVLPRAVGPSLTAVRNANNESPLGMVMAHPLYSVGFSAGLDPRLHSTHPYNPHPYFDTLAMISPQPMSVVQSIPMNVHPVSENRPQRNPEVNHQRLPYRNLVPQTIHVPYQSSHSSDNDRQPTLHRNPENNAQSNIQNSVPETSGLNYAQDRPMHDRHRELQYIPANIHPHYPPLRNINEETVHQRLQDNRELTPLYRSPLPNRQQQIRNEGHDRHLYYTPLSERDPLPQRNLPTYPSREIRRPIDDSHLHRTRIIPQENSRETHQTHSGERQYLPQSRIPTSPPRIQHIPHYTVVPQENLPKYLQNPTYSSAERSSERRIPNTRYSSPGNTDTHTQQPYRSASDSRYETPHHNHRPHHSSERDGNVPEGYRSLPVGAMSEEIHHASRDSRHETPPVRTSKPAYSSETVGSRESLEQNPTTTRRHKPIGKVYSVPQYQIPPRESQQREDEAVSKIDDIQHEDAKRRRKYKLSEMEPHKKEAKKRRKSLKADYEDLQAHSSHQYIIKIG